MEAAEIKYDIRKLKAEDRVVLDLQGEGPWLTNYQSAIYQARNSCCRGGTMVLGIPSTYDDPNHPIFILTIMGSYNNIDVTTSFIVYKLNSYFSGYAHHDIDMDIRSEDIDWFICEGSRVVLSFPENDDEVKMAGFSVDYTADIITELSKNMGVQSILRALYKLKFKNEKNNAFMIICHLFAEPLRFTAFYQAVAERMFFDANFFQQGVLDPTTWETLSKNVVHFSRKMKFIRTDLHDLQRLQINKDNFRSKIAMLLREDPDAKLRWKEKMRSEFAQNFFGKREIRTGISRRPPILLGTGSSRGKQSQQNLMRLKKDLYDQQCQVQEMLILSGGLPDVWNNIFRALKEPEDYICGLIVENSDFYVASQDLSYCFDFYGTDYRINEAAMSVLRSFVDG